MNEGELNNETYSSNEELIETSTEIKDKKPITNNRLIKLSVFFSGFIALFIFLILILHYPSNPTTLWEYKTIRIYGSGYSREGSEAFRYSSIFVSEDELNKLGNEGWELVSTVLEMETAFPNFGNSSYVAGIQPNIRPQCLICVFKRVKVSDEDKKSE